MQTMQKNPAIGMPEESRDRLLPEVQPDGRQMAAAAQAPKIGPEQLLEFDRVLMRYKAGKTKLERRVIASENWWKLRNGLEEDKEMGCRHEGFRAKSGWLHNVIVSKHADMMEAYPEPNILPREESDRKEAQMLSSIVPCVLEQNCYENVYASALWQKLKTGTSVQKVVWDKDKLGGMGDVAVQNVNLLNLFWEPGKADIQDSRYVFHVELEEEELLEQMWPQLQGKAKRGAFQPAKFSYDDNVDSTGKALVVDVYYKVRVGARNLLHYCKYVGDTVLYATENDEQTATRGLYDHGKYPFVFDALYPVEGYPNCGYGFVDLCKSPQTEIDLMKTAYVRNAKACATPRYFRRTDGGINDEQFLDLENELVDTDGNLGEDSIRRIESTALPGVYVDVLQQTIHELRETSGNTETATGTASSGVTAASAIAALQEASGKGSRDATASTYRAYTQVVELVIELIRQFYDVPRKFRILGQYGTYQYVSYSNSGLKPQDQGVAFEQNLGYRMPVFDIRVSAQKRNAYTKVAQNELAIQFFQLGFFNPQMTDQALMCMEMMDFDGKDALMQKIAAMGTMAQQLQLYQQLAITLCSQYRPDLAQQLAAQAQQGAAAAPAGSMKAAGMLQGDAQNPLQKEEHAMVRNARQQSVQASQPTESSAVLAKEEKK